MKKMLVLGMTFVVLLVSVVTVHANLANEITDEIPDDQTLLDWYVKYEYDSGYHAVLHEDTASADSLEEQFGCDYIDFYAVDDNGDVYRYCTVCRSYVESLYLRNN